MLRVKCLSASPTTPTQTGFQMQAPPFGRPIVCQSYERSPLWKTTTLKQDRCLPFHPCSTASESQESADREPVRPLALDAIKDDLLAPVLTGPGGY